MRKWCCNISICLLAEEKGFYLAKKMKNEKHFNCDDGFGEGAAWWEAWCGLGGGWEDVWAVYFFRGAVHSSRFLSANPLAFPKFEFLFPPRFQHKCVPLNSINSSLSLRFSTTGFLTTVAYCTHGTCTRDTQHVSELGWWYTSNVPYTGKARFVASHSYVRREL